MISTILNLINKYNLCPQMSKEEWLPIVMYMEHKGWIHLMMENGRTVGMWGGWRIEEFNEKVYDNLPREEKGNILYIPFACSEFKDRLIFLKEARKLNNIKEIIFNEHKKNGRLHRIKIRGNYYATI